MANIFLIAIQSDIISMGYYCNLFQVQQLTVFGLCSPNTTRET